MTDLVEFKYRRNKYTIEKDRYNLILKKYTNEILNSTQYFSSYESLFTTLVKANCLPKKGVDDLLKHVKKVAADLQTKILNAYKEAYPNEHIENKR